jgi:hypothetical protein
VDVRLKSLATLAVLGGLLLAAGVWGWSAVTEPFPDKADPPICVDRPYGEGDKLVRREVTVSVWNAGSRNGLAGLTMELLIDAGFGEGREANAPRGTKVARAQIWTDLGAKHPAVRLVRSHFKPKPKVVGSDGDAPGVLVVVGDRFQELTKGRRQVPVKGSIEVCGPPEVS